MRIINSVARTLDPEHFQRLLHLSQESPELAGKAMDQIQHEIGDVLSAKRLNEVAQTAERVIARFETMLPEWRAERARLRAEAERQLNLAAAADAERRAAAQAEYNRLAAPQILELARAENVTLIVDDGGNIIANGAPSPLLRAHIRLNRDDVISTIRHRPAFPIL